MAALECVQAAMQPHPTVIHALIDPNLLWTHSAFRGF